MSTPTIGITAWYDTPPSQGCLDRRSPFAATRYYNEASCLDAAVRLIQRGRAYRVAFPLFSGGGGGWAWEREEMSAVERAEAESIAHAEES
jgi:hypothetical protein